MKLSALLLSILSFNALANCDALEQRVNDDVDYLWSLKLNTVQVTAKEYNKAYKSYQSNMQALAQCKAK